MKRIAMLLIVILYASSVQAQTDYTPFDRPFLAVAGGGLTVPTSDFSDVFKTGLHIYVGGGVPIGDFIAGVAKIEYVENEYDPSIAISQGKGSDFLSLMFGVDLLVTPPNPTAIQPFALVGGGFASVTMEELQTADLTAAEVQETKLYFNVGAGVSFQQFGPFSVFLTTRWVVQEMPAQFVTNPTGGSYHSIPITVGIRF